MLLVFILIATMQLTAQLIMQLTRFISLSTITEETEEAQSIPSYRTNVQNLKQCGNAVFII